MSGHRVSGRVKFFNTEKCYGFITPDDGPDVFVHLNDIDGKKNLNTDQRVSFIVADSDRKGKGNGKKAIQVRPE